MTLPSFVLLSISWMVKCRVSLKFASDTGSSFPMNPLCIGDQEMGVLPTVTTAIFTAVNLVWFLDGLAVSLKTVTLAQKNMRNNSQQALSFPFNTLAEKRQSSLEYLYNVVKNRKARYQQNFKVNINDLAYLCYPLFSLKHSQCLRNDKQVCI